MRAVISPMRSASQRRQKTEDHADPLDRTTKDVARYDRRRGADAHGHERSALLHQMSRNLGAAVARTDDQHALADVARGVAVVDGVGKRSGEALESRNGEDSRNPILTRRENDDRRLPAIVFAIHLPANRCGRFHPNPAYRVVRDDPQPKVARRTP